MRLFFHGSYSLEVIGLKAAYRECRRVARISPTQAAAKLGVSVNTLYNWESGRNEMPADKLAEMALLYGVSANKLLGIDFKAVT